jgi:hypothetical protein
MTIRTIVDYLNMFKKAGYDVVHMPKEELVYDVNDRMAFSQCMMFAIKPKVIVPAFRKLRPAPVKVDTKKK